jgi:hypothetical protein
MKAVGYEMPLPIEDPQSLLNIEIPTPTAEGRDLLVEVKAISVNPVDVKVRAGGWPDGSGYKILGWDAAGVASISETRRINQPLGPSMRFFRPPALSAAAVRKRERRRGRRRERF